MSSAIGVVLIAVASMEGSSKLRAIGIGYMLGGGLMLLARYAVHGLERLIKRRRRRRQD